MTAVNRQAAALDAFTEAFACNGCDSPLPRANAPCAPCGEAMGAYVDDGLDPLDRPLSPAVAAKAAEYAASMIARESAFHETLAETISSTAKVRDACRRVGA